MSDIREMYEEAEEKVKQEIKTWSCWKCIYEHESGYIFTGAADYQTEKEAIQGKKIKPCESVRIAIVKITIPLA